MKIIFGAILILATLTLSVFAVRPTNAQSIPTPSVPEFTVKFVHASYGVTTTNPYTGVNTTETFDNSTIEVIISNQPFTAYYDASIERNISLYYNVQDKGHYSENWDDIYSGFDNANPYPTPSNSKYTVLSMSSSDFPAGGQVDFQVEAMIGWINETYYMNWVGPTAGPEFIFNFVGEESGWSNTQTITIPLTPSASTSTTQTGSQPTSTGSQSTSTSTQNPTTGIQTKTGAGVNWTQIALYTAIVIIAAMVIAFVALARKRKVTEET